MIKTVKIKRADEIERIKVLFGKIDGEFQVKTEPYNMVVEDAVGNMLDDIGEFDFEYLKEALVFELTLVSSGL
jgi:hypothetical protein